MDEQPDLTARDPVRDEVQHQRHSYASTPWQQGDHGHQIFGVTSVAFSLGIICLVPHGPSFNDFDKSFGTESVWI